MEETSMSVKKRKTFGMVFHISVKLGDFAGINFCEKVSHQTLLRLNFRRPNDSFESTMPMLVSTMNRRAVKQDHIKRQKEEYQYFMI